MKINPAIVLLFLLQGLIPAHAAETLTLNSGQQAPLSTPENTGVIDVVYQNLARRLGITILIQHLPAERALINANTGIEDGDICRVAGLSKKYPNLLRVPEVLMPIKLVALSKNFNFTVSGFESLQPYHVGFVIGRKALEEKVKNVKTLTKFATDEEIIAALDKNQIDVGIMEKSQAMMRTHAYPSLKILQPPCIRMNAIYTCTKNRPPGCHVLQQSSRK